MKRLRVICFIVHAITQHAAPHQCREKPRSGLRLPAWGGAARCLMSDVFWCSAVGTVAGLPAQGGIQILGSVPLFLERCVNVVLLMPCVGLTDGIESSFGVGLADGIRLYSLLFLLWECTCHARVLRCSCL